MKKLLTLLLILFCFCVQAQEICNNAIDDDNDGLVDLNDTIDCYCTPVVVTVPSLIPNPSFEVNNCLPSSFSQLNCASGWVQATAATSDYLNQQSFNPTTYTPPDGQGFVGAIYALGYLEYIGSCLSSPMLAGINYTFDMSVTSIYTDGYLNFSGVIPSQSHIVLYGNNNCASLPLSGAYGCPEGQAGWYAIDTIYFVPTINSWQTVTFNFTPTSDIGAIMLGATCEYAFNAPQPPLSGGIYEATYEYVMFDNLILSATSALSAIDTTGSWCSNDLMLHADTTTGATYQWYYEGVAIVGQTDTILNLSALNLTAGTYSIITTFAGNCTRGDIEVSPPVTPTIVINGPTFSCIDASPITFSATPSGGSWTGQGISSSGQFNPSLAGEGQFTLNYQISGVCNASSNTTISVDSCNCSVDQIRQVFTTAGMTELQSCQSDCSLYFLNNQSMTGSQAQAYAQTFGANLISIQSLQENQCIINNLNGIGASGTIWLGLSDEIQEGTFLWYDGAALNYSNWAPGEPNNTSGIEDCVQIYPDGSWNDLSCDAGNSRSIIEVNLCPVVGLTPIQMCNSSNYQVQGTALLGSAPYTYNWSLNNVNSNQNTSIYTDVLTTSSQITLEVDDRYGCSANATILLETPPVLLLPNDTCFAGTFQLDATTNFATYLWQDGSLQNTYTVTGPGVYSVEVQYPLGNILVNSDFEQGNNLFQTQYTAGVPGGIGPNTDPTTYVVDSNPLNGNVNFTPCSDHSVLGDQMMIVNGSDVANTPFWCQTVPVTPQTNYQFQGFFTSAADDPTPPIVQLTINGIAIGSGLNLDSQSCNWQAYTEYWSSMNQTSATVCLVDLNMNIGGNDFLADDISFSPLCSLRDTIVVYGAPQLSVSTDTICFGETGVLTVSGAANYVWSPGVTLNTITGDSVSVFPTQTTNYTVIGTENGCADSIQTTVYVNPLPTGALSGGTNVCLNGNQPTVLFTGFNGLAPYTFSYSLNNGPLQTITTTFGDTVSLSVPTTVTGTYSYELVSVSSGNGCSQQVSDTATVVVGVPMDVVIDAPTSICQGQPSVDIHFIGSNGSPAYTFDYTINGGGAMTVSSGLLDTATVTLNTVTPGFYTYQLIELTDGNGCQQVLNDSFTVEIKPTPQVNTVPNISVCAGDMVSPQSFNTVPSGGQVSWLNSNPSVGLSLSGNGNIIPFTAENVTNSPSVATVMIQSSLNGCVGPTNSFTITVNPLPTASAGSDLMVCQNETNGITLGENAQLGNSYSWFPNIGLSNASVSNPQIITSASFTETYTLTVLNSFGCENSDSVSVIVNPLPVPSFIVNVPTGCIPVSVSFTNTSVGSVNCEWNLESEGNINGCSNFTQLYDTPGIFDVQLTITDGFGCTNSLTQNDIVTIAPDVNADFELDKYEFDVLDTEVECFNNSTNATSYSWNFGDGTSSMEINPSHVYPGIEGGYTIVLVASNENGCIDTAYAQILIREVPSIFVPNTFTPDGNEYNNVFLPVLSDAFDYQSYNLLIFNRWGEIIFESNDVSIGWDGTYNGELCKQDTYVWKITVKSKYTDERIQKTGHLNLLK